MKATHTATFTVTGKRILQTREDGARTWQRGPEITRRFTVTADLDMIVTRLAERAAHSPRRMARAMRGAIIVRASDP